MFENGKFQMKFFLGIPPLQNGNEIFRKIPPPSKDQKRFEGGVFIVNPPDV